MHKVTCLEGVSNGRLPEYDVYLWQLLPRIPLEDEADCRNPETNIATNTVLRHELFLTLLTP